MPFEYGERIKKKEFRYTILVLLLLFNGTIEKIKSYMVVHTLISRELNGSRRETIWKAAGVAEIWTGASRLRRRTRKHRRGNVGAY